MTVVYYNTVIYQAKLAAQTNTNPKVPGQKYGHIYFLALISLVVCILYGTKY